MRSIKNTLPKASQRANSLILEVKYAPEYDNQASYVIKNSLTKNSKYVQGLAIQTGNMELWPSLLSEIVVRVLLKDLIYSLADIGTIFLHCFQACRCPFEHGPLWLNPLDQLRLGYRYVLEGSY